MKMRRWFDIQADGEIGNRPVIGILYSDKAWNERELMVCWPDEIGPSPATVSRWEDDGGRVVSPRRH